MQHPVPDHLRALWRAARINRMDQDAFVLELDLKAPPDTVWHHLTDATALKAWYWPEQLEGEYTVNPVPGGSFRIASKRTGLAVSGTVLEAEAPSRLVKTWRWDDDKRETRVTISLVETPDGGTRLSLQHSGHTDEEQLGNHRTGWTDCLARLQVAVAGEGQPVIGTERDILDAVGRAFDHGGLVLPVDALAPEFFDLSSGLLGELFQKFANYRLKLAIVLPDPEAHGARIVELVREHQRHGSLRFFREEAAARDWIAS